MSRRVCAPSVVVGVVFDTAAGSGCTQVWKERVLHIGYGANGNKKISFRAA